MTKKLLRFAYRSLRRAFVLDITHLLVLSQHDAIPNSLPPGYWLDSLTAEDIRRFSADTTLGLDAAMAPRLALGRDFCLAVMFEGRPVSYSWYAMGSIEAEYNRGEHWNSGTAVAYGRDTVFQYKGITDSAHRGQGLHACIPAFALRFLSDRGITRIVSTTEWTNVASIRCFAKSGFRSLGLISRFGWREWTFARYPMAATQAGIRLGRFERPTHRRKRFLMPAGAQLTT